MPAPLLELHRYVWFLADGVFKQGQLLSRLLERGRNLFDGPIQSLPLPNDMPAEVPRIELRNQAGNLILRGSVDRITLEHLHDGELPQAQIEEDLRLIADLFGIAKDVATGRISRVAYNRERTYRDESAAVHLAKYFVKPEMTSRETIPPGALSRCENFEIHAHKTFTIGAETMINSWFRCRSAKAPDGQTPVLAIVQDLNTLSEDAATRDFATEEAMRLVQTMTAEVHPIFDLYFPEGVPS